MIGKVKQLHTFLLKAVRHSYNLQTPLGQRTVKTNKVTLTFQGEAPASIKTVYGQFKTEPVTKEPLRCYRCQRFGHSQKVCRAQAQCVICAGHHNSDVCLRRPNKSSSTVVPKCINCAGEPPSFSKMCPERIYHLPQQLAAQFSQAKHTQPAVTANQPGKTACTHVAPNTVSPKTVAATARLMPLQNFWHQGEKERSWCT